MKKKSVRIACITGVLFFAFGLSASAQSNILGANISEMSNVDIIFFLTVLSLLPSILIMMSSFTRIIIVLSFLRNALGLQQTPPNTVLIGIALFLSLFIMNPVLQEIKTTAYDPYTQHEITASEAMDNAQTPIKTFMLKQIAQEDRDLFVSISKIEAPASNQDLPLYILIPAFITSELKRAFTIGFLLFIPFIVIDLLVASILMSMGMVMLPPAMIALPFKILLFIMVDGWGFLFKSLVSSFNI